MQIDWIWLLLALPCVFVLGWISSRWDFQQMRLQNRRSPHAYFRGLNFLLHGDTELAVAQFRQAVRNDPDTPELQFALGQLARGQGDYTSAVQLHRHLLLRGDLSDAQRARAQYALALDYSKAGILDRAESALAQLENSAYAQEARGIRLRIYERLRDWKSAATLSEQMQVYNEPVYTRRQSHYWCEQALSSPENTEFLLARARAADEDAPRPLLALIQWFVEQKQYERAGEMIALLQIQTPQYLALLVQQWVEIAKALNQSEQAIQAMEAVYAQHPYLDFLEGLIALRGPAYAPEIYQKHLKTKQALAVATRWVDFQAAQGASAWPAELVQALDAAEKPLLRYRCMHCGFEGERHYWNCPGCQAWDSYLPQRIEDLLH